MHRLSSTGSQKFTTLVSDSKKITRKNPNDPKDILNCQSAGKEDTR